MIGEIDKVVVLELTEQEAVSFRCFREYQDLFEQMLKARIFETKNGVAILNFDAAGTLTEIRKDVLIYKRLARVAERVS
jgi:hypothetical protein